MLHILKGISDFDVVKLYCGVDKEFKGGTQQQQQQKQHD